MKKTVRALAILCALALALSACGPKNPTPQNGSSGTSQNVSSGSENVSSKDNSTLMAAEYLSGDYDALPADGATYNLVLAHASGENTTNHQVMLALKEALEYYSNGKMNLTIYPNGQLGSDAETISSCIAGDIDIVMQSGSTHATFVPETQIFDTPFLFSGIDIEKIEDVIVDSEFRDLYNQANENAGLKCLMLVASETMDLTSNRAVYNLDDLKGLKIRTAQSESRMKIWSALGANPTPLAYSELYMALQNGTVEASDNIYANDVSGGFGEQQKYIIPTDHFLVSFDATMNLDKYNSLPVEYQNMLSKICTELTHYNYALSVADIEKNFQTLVNDYNMEICEISDDFRAQLIEGSKPAVDAAKQLVGNDALYDALDRCLNK